MRAWLFYSVELLDRANTLYLVIFIYDIAAAFVLLLFCTHALETVMRTLSQWLSGLLIVKS